MKTLISAALVGATFLLAWSPDARACGGLFCSAANPVPVDQNAERILFEIEPDGSVTATVEIKYSGEPQDFSWIVPVPETPVLGVVPANTLALLDQATQPTFTPPPTNCEQSFATNFVPLFGCNADLMALDGSAGGEQGVDVTALERVGPYDDIVVVEGEDPEALVAWLQDNDYVVTTAMEPLIAAYVEEGYKFLAVKLAPDAGVGDILPLRFTCPAQDGLASIPLRLTGLSAEPEMSIIVFVAGAQRYAPASYRAVTLDDDNLQVDPVTGQTNYYALAQWLIDQEGGKAFLTEYADGRAALQARMDGVFVDEESALAAEEIVGRHAFFTRMYTRISGWEMDEDAAFRPMQGGSVSGVRDLSSRTPVEVCGPDRAPSRVSCGDTYCGVGSSCASTAEAVDGCVCREGTSARRVQSPSGPSVFCQERGLDYLADLSGLGEVCAQQSCGESGRCVVVNGFPSCTCDEGFAAVAIDEAGPGDHGVRCREVRATYGPERLLWTLDEVPLDAGDGGCTSAGRQASSFFAFLALAFGALFTTRRWLQRPRW